MDKNFISTEQWKTTLFETQIPPEGLLRKGYVADEIKIIEAERQIRFVISTNDVDRDRDTIAVDGWDFTDYRRNAVVLFAHNYAQPPIAKTVELMIADGKVKSLVEFPTRETYEFADTIYRLIKGGYLHATSVGFRPIEWHINEERSGVDFTKQSLLEFSVVPIPSNPHALVEAKQYGRINSHDAKLYIAWCEELLDTWHGEKGLWMPRTKIEQAFEALKTTTYVPVICPDPVEPPETAEEADASVVASTEAPVFDVNDWIASATAAYHHHDDGEDVLAWCDPEAIRELLLPVLRDSVSAAMKTQITALTGRLVD